MEYSGSTSLVDGTLVNPPLNTFTNMRKIRVYNEVSERYTLHTTNYN